MRILFCNKYNFRFSGTEVYLFELLDLLRAAGHEVALFAMECAEGVERGYRRYLVPQIDFKDDGLLPWRRAKQALHAAYSVSVRRTFSAAIDDFRPDIVHVRNIYHHLSPSILWECRAKRLPVLYHVNDLKAICPTNALVSHGRPCERCRGGAFWHVATEGCYCGTKGASLVLLAEAYVHKWVRTYSKCVTRTVAPSEFVRQKLVENGWAPEKIEVLYHFQEVAKKDSSRPERGAPILYFGRLSPEKGIVDLLRAMQRNPNIPLVIAGEGPQRFELERLARDLHLHKVTFTGKLDGGDLHRAIATSRFTVFPSHAGEVLGKSILESYAHGKPVIATNLGSRREVVIEGQTGLLYHHGNVEELAAKIAALCADLELTEKLGRGGRNLLVERHSPADHLAKLTRIYESLVEKPKVHGTAEPDSGRRRLRIAFVGGRGVVSCYSGIESFYEEAGKELTALGHDVTVYCRNHFTPPMKWHNGMRLLRLPTIRTKHLETFVHTFLSTVHAIFGRYDVVHYHTLGPALFCWMPRFSGTKTVVTVQGLDWQRRKWGCVASAVLRLGEMAGIRCPDTTMVVSRTLQEYFQQRYKKETVLIPNGTRLRSRCSGRFLESVDLTPGDYVLFLGRFSPEKNCDVLIRAYERIETNTKLALAGGSSYSDAYINELRSHASERVRFLNWVSGDDLEELLTNAMLFVLPSDLEGLSLALLDAMGAGLCVLASDIPENREIVEGAGFTFQAGNEANLAEMLRCLISNPTVREEAGRAARSRMQERYLWPLIAREIEREYLKVLRVPPQSDRDGTHHDEDTSSYKAA
ncbi:MAG TPA: glycosyltransferase family 4 protein [Terriglobales bacterium]|nr:glycosyltransferase family 4 protein [Terriglobales bacterium]